MRLKHRFCVDSRTLFMQDQTEHYFNHDSIISSRTRMLKLYSAYSLAAGEILPKAICFTAGSPSSF